MVVHIRGLVGAEGSLTCYLPVLVQGGLEDILLDEGGALGPEYEADPSMGPPDSDSMPPVATTRKRTIQETDNDDGDSHQD